YFHRARRLNESTCVPSQSPLWCGVVVILPNYTVSNGMFRTLTRSSHSGMSGPFFTNRIPLHPKHLHHLVTKVVDDLDRDAAGFGLFEGSGGVAVQGVPGFGVDFGLEGGFQAFVRVGGAEE